MVNRGKKIAVCLAFLREGYTTHTQKKNMQNVVYVLLDCKAALPVRGGYYLCQKTIMILVPMPRVAQNFKTIFVARPQQYL